MRVVAIELPDYDVSNTVIYTPAFVNMESHSWVRAPSTVNDISNCGENETDIEECA